MNLSEVRSRGIKQVRLPHWKLGHYIELNTASLPVEGVPENYLAFSITMYRHGKKEIVSAEIVANMSDKNNWLINESRTACQTGRTIYINE